MSGTQKTLVDLALAVGGAGLSTLLASTSGNGENPLPVAAGMLAVAAVVGAVSFALAWPVRTVPFAMVASVVITELGFVLFFVRRVALSAHVDEHLGEELYLLPQVFAVFTAPTVLLSAVGFGRMASRLYRRVRLNRR